MIIGRGTYGTIYDDGDGNATKRMNYEEGIPYCILREVSTMSLLQNCEQIPKIVKIKMGCDDIGITMKKYKMNLLQYRCEFKLTLFEIKKILYQILLGLHHGEKFGILHRDIKPDNIFMDSPDVVVVGDWGLSRLQDTKDDGSFSNLVQTKWYRAPEIVEISDDRNKDSVHNYNNIVDVWSVGCIMYELLFNRFFCETDDKLPASEHLEVIHSKILELDNYVPHTEVAAAILLKNMLEIDPNQRFTISQCLSDAFFADCGFPSHHENSFFVDFAQEPKTLDSLNFQSLQIMHATLSKMTLLSNMSSHFNPRTLRIFLLGSIYLSHCVSITTPRTMACLSLAFKILEPIEQDYKSFTHDCTKEEILLEEQYIFKVVFHFNLYPLAFLRVLDCLNKCKLTQTTIDLIVSAILDNGWTHDRAILLENSFNGSKCNEICSKKRKLY